MFGSNEATDSKLERKTDDMNNPYLTFCVKCNSNTSKAFAKANHGKCKACASGQSRLGDRIEQSRQARIIDSGWQAYAREEGHYDQGDY